MKEETYRRARIKAAERNTSVSALVREFLSALASEDENLALRLAADERALRERIKTFRAADRLSRDELHRRRQ